jgi:hypothetical protein
MTKNSSLPELIPLVDWVSGVPLVEAVGVVVVEVLSTDDCGFFCDKYPFLNNTSCLGVVIFVYSSKTIKKYLINL